jgi:hypothetical protein
MRFAYSPELSSRSFRYNLMHRYVLTSWLLLENWTDKLILHSLCIVMNGTALNTLVSSIFSIPSHYSNFRLFWNTCWDWLRWIALRVSPDSYLHCRNLVAAFPFILPTTTEFDVSYHERFFETLYSRWRWGIASSGPSSRVKTTSAGRGGPASQSLGPLQTRPTRLSRRSKYHAKTSRRRRPSVGSCANTSWCGYAIYTHRNLHREYVKRGGRSNELCSVKFNESSSTPSKV